MNENDLTDTFMINDFDEFVKKWKEGDDVLFPYLEDKKDNADKAAGKKKKSND